MAFTEEFLVRVEFAGESINFQQANYVNIIENLAVPLLHARQGLAWKIQSGNIQPEDEHHYVRQFENINNELRKLLGL